MPVTAIKFQRKMMKVTTNTRGDIEVPVSEAGGLAIHRALNPVGGKELFSDGWTVSHFASGMSLRRYIRTRKATKEAVEKILALGIIDWTEPNADILSKRLAVKPDTIKPIKDILEEAAGV